MKSKKKKRWGNWFSKTIDHNLNDTQKIKVQQSIAQEGIKRVKLIAILISIMDLLLIFLYDLKNLLNDVDTIDGIYFGLHMFIVIVSFIAFVVSNIILRKQVYKKSHDYVMYGFVFVLLLLLALINGLDQLSAGQILGYTINVLICAFFFLIRPPYDTLIYGISYIAFLSGVLYYQKDVQLLFFNIVNGTFFFVAALLISRIVYQSYYSNIAKSVMLEDANQKLYHLSNYDMLTDLPNRRSFELKVNDNLTDKNKESYLVAIDIDNFKSVNDYYGHPVGDLVLQEFSRILMNNIGDADFVARYGGEEFLLLISGVSVKEVLDKVNNLRVSIQKDVIIVNENKISVTASFGIVKLSGEFNNSFGAFYSLADNALYEAKKVGKNRVCIYDYISKSYSTKLGS